MVPLHNASAHFLKVYIQWQFNYISNNLFKNPSNFSETMTIATTSTTNEFNLSENWNCYDHCFFGISNQILSVVWWFAWPTSTHQTHDLNNQQLNGHKKYHKNQILHDQEFR